MRWVTRERAKVDRIACPWVIKRFVDPEADFVFVPADKVAAVARETGAIPFDTPGTELTHFKEGGKEYVSFDAVIRKYKLTDPALLELAKIVRGADARITDTPPEPAGLEAAAAGYSALAGDDHQNMKIQIPFYDALYEYCKGRLAGTVKLEHAKPGN